MFILKNNNKIIINRGDSGKFTLSPFIRNGLTNYNYVFNPEDEVYLGVMEPNQIWEEALIKKKYDYKDVKEDGTIDILFDSKDTQCLIPGLYYYQIKL